MIVVDTNVLAYLLIDGIHSAEARELYRRDPDWRSEAFSLIEFCNVLLRYIEARKMKIGAAGGFLASAETLLDGKLARISHQQCLEIGARYHVTAYDARFLAVAQLLHRPLVTEDQRLRRAAPALTCSTAEALATP